MTKLRLSIRSRISPSHLRENEETKLTEKSNSGLCKIEQCRERCLPALLWTNHERKARTPVIGQQTVGRASIPYGLRAESSQSGQANSSPHAGELLALCQSSETKSCLLHYLGWAHRKSPKRH